MDGKVRFTIAFQFTNINTENRFSNVSTEKTFRNYFETAFCRYDDDCDNNDETTKYK